MALATGMLKGARVQKVLVALFYLVSTAHDRLYIVCTPVKFFEVLCTLALLGGVGTAVRQRGACWATQG